MTSAQGYRAGCRDRYLAGGKAGLIYPGHFGAHLEVRSSTPPPVDQYNDWVSKNIKGTGVSRRKMTGSMLRRAVIMRRNGCSWPEVNNAIGYSNTRKVIARLPLELVP